MKKRVLVGTLCYNQPSAIAPLLASIRSDKYDLTIVIHQNGAFKEMTEAVDWAVEANKNRGVVLVHHWHSKNDGIAPCWNEILLESYHRFDPYDACIIANDDIVFGEGDIDRFADACIEHAEDGTSIIACRGNHTLHGPNWAIGYSCFAVTKGCFDRVGCFDENFLAAFHEDQSHAYRCKLAGLHEVGIIAGLTHGGSKHLLDDSALYVEAIRARNGITQPLNGEYYRRCFGGDAGHETFDRPFNDPRFTYHIAPEDRHAPYPGHNRTDGHIVTI